MSVETADSVSYLVATSILEFLLDRFIARAMSSLPHNIVLSFKRILGHNPKHIAQPHYYSLGSRILRSVSIQSTYESFTLS